MKKKNIFNLNPGFQRDSVWGTVWFVKTYRFHLSGNYPLPSIFLYKREDNGHYIYDVIDGKQRIESIFRFMGLIRGHRFSTISQVTPNVEKDIIDWHFFAEKSFNIDLQVTSFKRLKFLGELADIIDVFVRINSTGKVLTPSEKRHKIL